MVILYVFLVSVITFKYFVNCILGQLPNIEFNLSDTQANKLIELLITMPFGGTQKNLEVLDEADSYVTPRAKRTLPTIQLHEVMKDAIKFAKEAAVESETETTDSQQIIVHKDVIFKFTLNQIMISLFEGEVNGVDTALASAYLTNFDVDGEILTNGSLCTNCIIGDLCLKDVRAARSEKGIKEIIQKKYKDIILNIDNNDIYNI